MTAVFERLGRRMSMILGFGRQTADTVEAAGTATVQAAVANTELREGYPIVQDFGFVSRPVAGADLIVLFATSDRSRGVVVASGDQRHRPQTLQPGESGLYNTKGLQLLLAADGSVRIVPASGVVDIDGSLTVSGSITAQGEVTGNGVALSSHLTTGVTDGNQTSGPPQKS